MKKLLSVLLSAVLLASVFVLTSCQSESEDETPTATITAQTTSTPAATPTAAPTPTEEPTPTKEPVDYSGGLVSNEPMTVALYPENILEIGLQAMCGTGQSIALQFYATVPFNGIGSHSPTWTATEGFSLDYEIYAWNNNYYDTIWNDPILSITPDPWVDGQCAQVVFEPGEELPAGEYLLVAYYQSYENAKNSGVYYVEQAFPGTRAYLNDEVWDNVCIVTTLFYNTTPVNPYGPLSDPGLE